MEENKLESGADEWIGWEEAPPIWGCECAGLWGFVGAPGSEGFVGCAADVVSTIWGFFLERQQRANETCLMRKGWKGEKAEREKPV